MAIGAINNVNNISFSGKAKNNEEKKKGRYFEWLSKKDANDALKLSKGREKRDGKFKFASAMAEFGSITSVGVGLHMLFLGAAKVAKVGIEAASTRIIDLDKVQSATKNMKYGGVAMLAAGALTIGAKMLTGINKLDAERTAHARGFYTNGDLQRTFGANKVYEKTEEVYDRHVTK